MFRVQGNVFFIEPNSNIARSRERMIMTGGNKIDIVQNIQKIIMRCTKFYFPLFSCYLSKRMIPMHSSNSSD